ELPAVRSKDDRLAALRAYEAERPQDCVLIASEDDFYGINGTGKLSKFIQWVYVPAVKDARDEESESKNSALSKLLSRAVEERSGFDAELKALKDETIQKYDSLVEKNQACLTEISQSLQTR